MTTPAPTKSENGFDKQRKQTMKTRLLSITGSVAVLLLGVGPLQAAEQLTRLDAKPGLHKVRIEGTSSMHDWQVEGTIIAGYIEVGPNFPVQPGQEVQPGKTEARLAAFIPVRSLKSINKDGTPYHDKMNEVMYEKLKQPVNPRILYRLSELTLKEAPKTKDAPYVFDSKGDLVVAGVTNNISMAVNVTALGDKKVKITGNTAVKMTDFRVEPPNPAIGLGLIKTGDEVKLSFEWTVGQKPASAAGK